jgi:branched-subunit amino acid ABC-type transport system permease component
MIHNNQLRAQGLPVPARPHDPALAAVLAALIGCLASMIYNRQPLKAVVTVLVGMVAVAVTGGVAFLVIYPAVIVDAYLVGKRIQRGETVSDWQYF